MSTTPKPVYTLKQVEDIAGDEFGGFTAHMVRATVEALDAAQARVKELETLMLAVTKSALRNGVLHARAEKAEAALAQLMEAGTLLDRETEETVTTLMRQLTESRANEARMREALVKVLPAASDGYGHRPEGKSPGECAGCDAVVEARVALSAPASDWLAARDRRVAEAVAKTVSEQYFKHVPTTALMQDRMARCVDRALVEFKPEGA